MHYTLAVAQNAVILVFSKAKDISVQNDRSNH